MNRRFYRTVRLDRPRIVLKLDREDQLSLVAALSGIVVEAERRPRPGRTFAWFEKTDLDTLASPLKPPWANVAPKRRVKLFSGDA